MAAVSIIIVAMRIIILILIFVNLIALSAAQVGETDEIFNAEKNEAYGLEYATDAGGIDFNGVCGAEVGKISIKRLGIEGAPLYYLPTKDNLKKGVCMDGPPGGWQIVGEKGRGMISAHNDKAFKHLDRLESGDVVSVFMEYGDFEFQVEEVCVYNGESGDWKKDIYENTGEYGLALVTCYPLNKRNTTGDRLVVKCGAVAGY